VIGFYSRLGLDVTREVVITPKHVEMLESSNKELLNILVWRKVNFSNKGRGEFRPFFFLFIYAPFFDGVCETI
jgi:hypothetical protein